MEYREETEVWRTQSISAFCASEINIIYEFPWALMDIMTAVGVVGLARRGLRLRCERWRLENLFLSTSAQFTSHAFPSSLTFSKNAFLVLCSPASLKVHSLVFFFPFSDKEALSLPKIATFCLTTLNGNFICIYLVAFTQNTHIPLLVSLRANTRDGGRREFWR